MIKLGTFTTILLFTAIGCGDNARSGSASGVFPAQGFTGRTVRVEVSGDLTNWQDGAQVSFGDGVMVSKVSVASPTDVFADITIDPAAQIGTRDVTVTSGGTFTLKNAFELVAPVELQTKGQLAQGSLFTFKLVNKDFDNPFDTTTAVDPTTGATTFPNLTITGPAGIALQSPLTSSSFTVSAFEIDGLALIDVDAQSGAVQVASGDPSMQPVTSVTASLAVASRQPTALVSGTATSGSIAMPFASTLYTLPGASSAPQLVRMTLVPALATAQPFVAMLGSSGHWATDFLGAAATVHAATQAADAVYGIVVDLSGTSGYNYSLTGNADHLTVAAAPAEGSNTTEQTAMLAAGAPFLQTGGSLATAGDVDFIKYVATAADVGKKFHVTTLDGTDPFTDVTIDVQEGNGQHTSISGGAHGGCGLFGCGTEFLTSAIPSAGNYFFKITTGPSYTTTDTTYSFLFWLE